MKKFFCKAIVLLILVIITINFYGCKSAKSVVLSPSKIFTVVLDAGHGGIDGGVSGVVTGAKESDINLAITKCLCEVFKRGGFNVCLTRKTSGGLYGYLGAGHKKRDMSARLKIIKTASPSVVISIHQNFFSDKNRRGATTFYKKGCVKSKELATFVQNSLNDMPTTVKRGIINVGDYFILNTSPCPAVIVECGFLSNAQDEELLLSSDYQQSLCQAIFYGVLQYLSEL